MFKILFGLVLSFALLTSPANASNDSVKLHRGEANYMVRLYLTNYLSDTVTKDASKPKAKASKCSTVGTKGVCDGSLVVGEISCQGLFGIKETPKNGGNYYYIIWPIDITCQDLDI